MAVGMNNNKRQNRKRKINDTTLLSDSFKEELNSRGNGNWSIYFLKIVLYQCYKYTFKN